MIIDMPTVSIGNSGSILPADKVSYSNTTSGLTADNVQDAVDEVNDRVDEIALRTYSSEEKVVGKWIDGSDVYEKSWHGTATTYTDYTNRRNYELIFEENIPSGIMLIGAEGGIKTLHSNPERIILASIGSTGITYTLGFQYAVVGRYGRISFMGDKSWAPDYIESGIEGWLTCRYLKN